MKAPLLALAVILAAAGGAFAATFAKPHADTVLLEIKKDDCCQACVKIDGSKSCKTFCGKDADDQCDAFKAAGKAEKKQLAKLKKAPCYSICSDQCAKTRTNLTPQQCIGDCLNRTRC